MKKLNNLKKIAATMVATSVLMSSGVVFAASTDDPIIVELTPTQPTIVQLSNTKQTTKTTTTAKVYANQGKAEQKQGKVEQKQDKADEKQAKAEYKTQFKAKLATIKANEQANHELYKTIKFKLVKIKNKIKDLEKNPEALNAEKVAEIKEKISLLKGDKAEITQTLGKINQQKPQIKLAKKNNDHQAALANLDKIIAVQKERNTALKAINADLDALLAAF